MTRRVQSNISKNTILYTLLFVVLVLVLLFGALAIKRGHGFDLYTSFTGALFAGLLAYFIARWQLKKESARDNAKNKLLLSKLMISVVLEVRDNSNSLNKLEELLLKHQNANAKVWDLAIAFLGGLSDEAYKVLVSSDLLTYLSDEVLDILITSYSMVQGVKQLVSEGKPGHEYAYTYNTPSNKQSEAEVYLQRARSYTTTTKNYLKDEAVPKLYKAYPPNERASKDD